MRRRHSSRAWTRWLVVDGLLALATIAALHLFKGARVEDLSDLAWIVIASVVLAMVTVLLGALLAIIPWLALRRQRRFAHLWGITSVTLLILVGGLMLVQA